MGDFFQGLEIIFDDNHNFFTVLLSQPQVNSKKSKSKSTNLTNSSKQNHIKHMLIHGHLRLIQIDFKVEQFGGPGSLRRTLPP